MMFLDFFVDFFNKLPEVISTKEDIVCFLRKNKILHYEIREVDNYFVVDVVGDCILRKIKLNVLPFKFGLITGNFDCSNNELTSLVNAPAKVIGNFNCANNKLTSLEHGPSEVGISFDCSYNILVNLKYSPKVIKGDFWCFNNVIKTLKDCPEMIDGEFSCYNNKIEDIEYLPKLVLGNCFLYNNPLPDRIQDIATFDLLNRIRRNKKFKSLIQENHSIHN